MPIRPPSRILLALLLLTGGAIFRIVAALPVARAASPLPVEFRAAGLSLEPIGLGEVEETLGADTALFFEARTADGREAGTLFVAYFGDRRRGAEPHAPEVCYRASGWRLSLEGPVAGAPGRGFAAASGDAKRVVAYWYETRRGIVSSPWRLKWDLLAAALSGDASDALFVRVAVPAGESDGDAGALSRLAAFARSIEPSPEGMLRRGREPDQKE